MARRLPIAQRRPNAPAEQAAIELAVLIFKTINTQVDPELLLDLLHRKFHTLSALCHEIHDGIENDLNLKGRLTARTNGSV